MDIKKKRFNDVNVAINKQSKYLLCKGPLGTIQKTVNGTDIYLFKKKIFIRSKNSLFVLKALINAIHAGVLAGYFLELNFLGLGYRFLKFQNYILLKLGYSHYIKVKLPLSLQVYGYKRKLIIFGMDLREVNSFAAMFKRFKKPNVYKAKGIQIVGETVTYKIGKQK